MKTRKDTKTAYPFKGVLQLVRRTFTQRSGMFVDEEDYQRLHEIMVQKFNENLTDVLAYTFTPHRLTMLYKYTHGEGALRPKALPAALTRYAACRRDKYWAEAETGCGGTKFCCPVSDEYLANAIRFVHMDPVKSLLCDRPEDWKYSSYHFYIGGADDKLVKPGPEKPSPYQLSVIDTAIQQRLTHSVNKEKPAGDEAFNQRMQELRRAHFPPKQ